MANPKNWAQESYTWPEYIGVNPDMKEIWDNKTLQILLSDMEARSKSEEYKQMQEKSSYATVEMDYNEAKKLLETLNPIVEALNNWIDWQYDNWVWDFSGLNIDQRDQEQLNKQLKQITNELNSVLYDVFKNFDKKYNGNMGQVQATLQNFFDKKDIFLTRNQATSLLSIIWWKRKISWVSSVVKEWSKLNLWDAL